MAIFIMILPSTRSSLTHPPSITPTTRVIIYPTLARTSFPGLHTSLRPRLQPVLSVTDYNEELEKVEEELTKLDLELKKIDAWLKKIKEADLNVRRKMAYLTVIQCLIHVFNDLNSSPFVIPSLLKNHFKTILRRGTYERKTVDLQDLELIMDLVLRLLRDIIDCVGF